MFSITASPPILMNEHSFDAFSLKTKESGRKNRRSAPRDKILSVKVDDLTGYETCQTNDMGMRCGHVRMCCGHVRMCCGHVRMRCHEKCARNIKLLCFIFLTIFGNYAV